MTTQIELFTKMVHTLDRLIENAQKMKEGLRLKYSQSEIEHMQRIQHEILQELGSLNSQLEKSPPGATNEEIETAKALIREKLGHFQVINKDFFDSISTHTRVIDASERKERKG